MKRKCENCNHYKCFINKHCSSEWKPLITFYKSSTDYPAGTTIFSEGDPVEGIYQIYSGKIKVVTSVNGGIFANSSNIKLVLIGSFPPAL